MEREHLEMMLEVAMFKEFDSGEIIFREGEPANRFYLICQGKVAVETQPGRGPATLIQTLGTNDVLGWSWLFPPHHWHFSARAVEPTRAVFFYGTRLRKKCEDDPVFGFELMKRVAGILIHRLQHTRLQMLSLAK
jgi:CRP-like cAMP-binding protein